MRETPILGVTCGARGSRMTMTVLRWVDGGSRIRLLWCWEVVQRSVFSAYHPPTPACMPVLARPWTPKPWRARPIVTNTHA